ncbi:MAG: hypothetical protein HC822_09645 [Oscillochloris sp.]|nr:hypothetical protein [Oscillochloris sp.]
MMLFTRNELRSLIEATHGWCISLFMPAERGGPETRQNPIRFSNLLRDAEAQMNEHGIAKDTQQQLMQPLHELLDDYDFWQHQDFGLAVVRSADMLRIYRAPLEFDELVLVGQRPYVKPLLRLLAGNGRFYALALSMNDVRLFEGSRFGLTEIGLDEIEMPQSLDEAMQFDDPEQQLQFFSGVGPSTGGDNRAAVFYGTEDNTNMHNKQNIRRFFDDVAKGLDEVFGDDRAPLVLIGVEYLLPLYREANNYQGLIDAYATGNPDQLRPDQIHEQVWPLVEPHFLQDQENAKEQFGNLSNTERASDNLNVIVSAAEYGRVDRLFVPIGAQRWGRFDHANNRIQVDDAPSPENEDLLDRAAMHTILNSGTVYAVAEEEMPQEKVVAAIFRY